MLQESSTLLETISTFQIRPAVDPFKSGEETSVKVAPEVSQTAYI